MSPTQDYLALSTPLLKTILANEEQKLLACVHCGLCLEACPTYTLTGDENDSPRGRIYLMRAVAEEKLSADSYSFRTHIDRCLGCRACEPVCPAGVEYGQLLEASRATIYPSEVQKGFSYRLLRFVLRHVWLQPGRLRFSFALARILRNTGLAKLLLKSRVVGLFSKRVEFGLGLLVSSAPQMANDAVKELSAAAELDQTQSALLFTGCVTEGLFARVNEATKRVLRINGVEAEVAPNQVCCGALHAHAGDLEGARLLARQNISAFGGDAPVITNAGGCGAMLVSYAHLLAGDATFAEPARRFSARVRDFSQQLETKPIVKGARLDGGVTYDASCHLLNGQHAAEAPLKILRAIPDLNFKPLEGAERCCGSAGVYNLLEPEMSQGVLQEKLAHIRETGATVLATGNPGCQMQIGAGSQLAGMELRVCHPVELLDLSYRRAGFYAKHS
ncbi:MAG TPA: heterodisulfide reductase-related iron-sulfur binding cluster [Pyrinomonadaceae bacterium]|nr:heterodisulfide reductase-related iron-sulfur binding cluster [Pyrinomonadaceae bacterium]